MLMIFVISLNMKKIQMVDLKSQYQKIEKEIDTQVLDVVKSTAYINGPEVKMFQAELEHYLGVKHVIPCANGTDALQVAMMALGLQPGDEVITADFTYVATAEVIALLNLTPVLVDVLPNTFDIDVNAIEKAITSKTKAIIPVHLTGRVADMEAIQQIAKKNNLLVIEDAAQAIGASYKDKKSGSFGDTGCFSLHPLKNLHVHGDGGVLTTNNEVLYEKILKMRNHGLKNRGECEFWGWNSRLDEIQAAIANLKLNYLDEWNNKYLTIAKFYIKELNGIVELPSIKKFEKPVFHRFIIQHEQRDSLRNFLASKGIQTAINYPLPLHLHEASQGLGYRIGDFPMAEKQAKEILSLPIYPELKKSETQYVVKCVKTFLKLN